MYDLTKHTTLKQCQRSFNMDTAVDLETLKILNDTAEKFILENKLSITNFFITNPHEIKIIHSAALIENEPIGLEWKTNTQVLAPLLILSHPSSSGDVLANSQIGRLYAKLGLIAIERGYQTGFCLCINNKVLNVWDLTRKYIKLDADTGLAIPPIFLSIGKPIDENKPYNWSAMHNKYNPSHVRRSDANIEIKQDTFSEYGCEAVAQPLSESAKKANVGIEPTCHK